MKISVDLDGLRSTGIQKERGKEKMKLKKTLAAVFSAAVLSAAFSAAAFAAEVTVGTDEALRNAIARAGDATTIKLENDIAITDTVTIDAGKDITLDLGEHTLSCETPNTGVYFITNNGTLKVSKGNIIVKSSDIAPTDKTTTLIDNKTNAQLSMDNCKIYIEGCLNVVRNSGTSTLNNLTVNQPDTGLTIVVHNLNGTSAVNGGTYNVYGVLNDGGIVIFENNPQITCHAVLANGGTVNFNSGTFESPSSIGNLPHGIFITAQTTDAKVNIKGGSYSLPLQVMPNGHEASLNISGGTFSDTNGLNGYLAQDKEFNADGTVVDKGSSPIDLGTSKAFVTVSDNQVAGQYFDVVKTVDDKKMADATFTYDGKSISKTLDLSKVDGNGGDIVFSILLRGAPEGVTGTIFYR